MRINREENSMKFRQRITLSLLLYIVLGSAAFAQVVEIPDPNLRAAVRDTLNLPGGTRVTRDAMLQLIRIDVTDRGVETLTGLEFATNLTRLKIGYNPVTDLSPIAGLIKLESLYMWATPVSDITPVANLTNLNDFRASYCEITDISPLANLVKLEKLSLDGNQIVDVRPLAGLALLKTLNIESNLILDHSALDGLSLEHFTYDVETPCDMPPLPLKPRLENRTFPSVFAAWHLTINQPHLSAIENYSQHDLIGFRLTFNQKFVDTTNGWQIRGDPDRAMALRDEYLDLNPNAIFLAAIEVFFTDFGTYPEDSSYWLRDTQGQISSVFGAGRIDITHHDVQDRIVQQAIAISQCGLYDGFFVDWWSERSRSDAELSAMTSFLQRIRNSVRPDFLIMVNTNRSKSPLTGSFINGLFLESGVPGGFGGNPPEPSWIETGLRTLEDTLRWAEKELKSPQINGLEGWGFQNESPDSPLNRRWMRAFTTLSLTFSDGYILYNSDRDHFHYWYDFWDADLGQPVGEKAQLYSKDIPGLYIREFTNGWAIYNHSGAPQVITLPEEVQGVASGWVNTEHALPNLDGEMYLRVKPANPADVNDDGVVNILDLTLVAQGFGTDSLKADVNGDGVVNVFDLVFVANRF